MTGVSLGRRFATQPNALNAVRLALAACVIVWHSYSVTGHSYLPDHVERIMADLPVDAFFAISGFLICRAWQRHPHLGRFTLARTRRLLPGLWACLLVTAFVIAPVGTAAAGHDPLTLTGRWDYVLGNASTWVTSWGIDGGPTGVPRPGSWDGSLWSLGYEAACYIGVAVLGVTGLLRPRVMLAAAVACWAFGAILTGSGVPSSGLPAYVGPRTGLMFACGALLWMHRDRIPVTRALAAASTALIVVGAATPNYRLLAAPAVAYLCMTVALWLGQHPRLQLDHDLSYGLYVYGFPIQQALILAGVTTAWLPFAAASLACTLPAAALSWFLVEHPAIGTRQRATSPTPSPAHRLADPASSSNTS